MVFHRHFGSLVSKWVIKNITIPIPCCRLGTGRTLAPHPLILRLAIMKDHSCRQYLLLGWGCHLFLFIFFIIAFLFTATSAFLLHQSERSHSNHYLPNDL